MPEKMRMGLGVDYPSRCATSSREHDFGMELISPRIKSLRRAASDDPDTFWAVAADALPWFRPWEEVFDWDPEHPDEAGRYFRWFAGGRTNLAWNAVDRHVERGWGGH